MKTLLKLGKVLSTVTFVVSIVLTVICAFSIITANVSGNAPIAQFGKTKIYGLFTDVEEDHLTEMLVIIIIFSIASMVSGYVAMRFFSKEMKNATVFTMESSRACRVAGIWIIAANMLAVVVCGTLNTLFRLDFGEYATMNMATGSSVLTGIGFLVFSALIEAGYNEIHPEEKEEKDI